MFNHSFNRIKKSDLNSRTIGIVLYCYFWSFLAFYGQKRSTWNNSFYARQISTLPITSLRWDLKFRQERSKEQFHLRGWVGVLVDWRNGRSSSKGWGECRTDEIWDEQTRTVLFILRFAYWLQILRKHTSVFMVKIVVTIKRNLTTFWIEGAENFVALWSKWF